MAEYIKRDTLIEAIKAQFEGRPISEMDKIWNAALSCAIGQVESEPSADVVERKRGKWIKIKYRSICRDCSFRGFASWNFCPNCGADMRGEQDG